MKPLVIGVGNEHGGDDAVGRLVARRLADTGGPFDIAESHGISTDLIALFEGRSHVVIVDACQSGAAPGTLHWLNVALAPLPPDIHAVSSHGMGVAEALELARSLSLLPPLCQVAAIEGVRFDLGAELTPAVASAIPACVDRIVAEFS